MNRLLFGDDLAAHELNTPVDVVGPSEHIQINAKLDGFLEDAKVLTSPSLTLLNDFSKLSMTGFTIKHCLPSIQLEKTPLSILGDTRRF